MKYCMICGKSLDDGDGFCPYCGAEQPAKEKEPAIYEEYNNPVHEEYGLPPKRPGNNKKLIGIIIGVAAAAFAVTMIVMFLIGKGETSTVTAETSQANQTAVSSSSAVSEDKKNEAAAESGQIEKDAKSEESAAAAAESEADTAKKAAGKTKEPIPTVTLKPEEEPAENTAKEQETEETKKPEKKPAKEKAKEETKVPTKVPTMEPTKAPTQAPTPVPTQAPVQSNPTVLYTINTEVNVRTEPRFDSGKAAVLGGNEAVYFYGETAEGLGSDNNIHTWYHIQTASGKTGWIRGDLLQTTVSAPAAPQETETPAFYANGLNLRAEPTHDSAKVYDTYYGDLYDLGEVGYGLGSDGAEHEWRKVRTSDGVVGWVRSDLL